ncbi:hypothetical protein H4R21_000301 [Coemansia helicoidea]|nr:hypothetical protein H4R21_000301 [Coemansia helicoidea]
MKRDLANQDCPPPELVGDHAEWVVDQVCAERDGELGKEYLVKWLGYDESTWEPEGNLANASTLLAEFQKRSSGPEQCGPSKRPRSKSLPPNVG